MWDVHRVVELGPEQLPARLSDLAAPPPRLYVVGELPGGPCVAIVGTRAATAEGVAFAFRLASRLAREGIAIVSGGAEGIDRAAHEGALAGGGVTVVVSPSSYDYPYPSSHRALYREVIEQGGAYVSRHREDVKPARDQFFGRNEILAGLAHLLVVVESKGRGGARNAAKWARSIGRPVFAVPGPPWSPTSVGCIQELRAGARILTSHRDVLRFLSDRRLHGIPPAPSRALPLFPNEPAGQSIENSTPTFEGLPEPERVLEVLRGGPLHPDEIAQRTGLAIPRVQELLLTLTLKGALATHPAGTVALISH